MRRTVRFVSAGSACRDRRLTIRRCRSSTRSSVDRSRRGSTRTCARHTGIRRFQGSRSVCHRGPFSARAGVQTDKTAEALKEFFNEFTAILKPIPGDELDKAKNYVALGFPPSSKPRTTSPARWKSRSCTTCRRVLPGLHPLGRAGHGSGRRESRCPLHSSLTSSPSWSSAIARSSKPGSARSIWDR